MTQAGTALVSEGPDQKRIRVFLADDHALVREGLAALLTATPDMDVVAQCGDAVNVVQQVMDARPDVLLLDIEMPGLNGLDVLDQLRRRQFAGTVLIVSMHDSEEFILRALETGASGYLLKESAGNELLKAIQTVLSGGKYLDPAIDTRILSRLNRPRQDPYDTLTPRERQVLQLIAEGLTSRQIGERLGLSVKTVETHRMNLMRKLEIHDQRTLVRYYLTRRPSPKP